MSFMVLQDRHRIGGWEVFGKQGKREQEEGKAAGGKEEYWKRTPKTFKTTYSTTLLQAGPSGRKRKQCFLSCKPQLLPDYTFSGCSHRGPRHGIGDTQCIPFQGRRNSILILNTSCQTFMGHHTCIKCCSYQQL